MQDSEYAAHVDALEASISALCGPDAAVQEAVLDEVDRRTWPVSGRRGTFRERRVAALLSVVDDLRAGWRPGA